MTGFFDRLRSRSPETDNRGSRTRDRGPDRARAAFHDAVLAYPARTVPHPGFGREISAAQAQENLRWFRTTLDERLDDIRGLLSRFGVPRSPSSATPDAVDAWVTALVTWVRDCWPEQPFRPEHLADPSWLHSDRTGEDAVFSIAVVLATAMGEAVISCCPDWHWDVNSDPGDLRGEMLSSRRVVLTTAPLGPRNVRPVVDLETLVVERYRRPGHFLFSAPLEHDAWLVQVHDACTGRVLDLYRG